MNLTLFNDICYSIIIFIITLGVLVFILVEILNKKQYIHETKEKIKEIKEFQRFLESNLQEKEVTSDKYHSDVDFLLKQL